MKIKNAVYIQWLDHCAEGGHWHLTQDFKELAPIACESIGFIYSEDKKQIMLVQSRQLDGAQNCLLILKSCITKRKKL